MKRIIRLGLFGVVGLFIVVCGLAAMLGRGGARPAPVNPPHPTARAGAAPTSAPDPTAIPEGYLSRDMLGEKWPLTVEYGWIECDGSSILFRSAAGDYYAVNGTAQGRREEKGWRDIHDIDVPIVDVPGTIISLQPLLDVGLKMCR